jgi:serine/threonine-protein kinase
MGTLGYMSPEQVRGLAVDHRSDIFSFGAVLYELVSGKRAFKRETAADTMAAIMKEEPPELMETGRNVSPNLDHIVKHCLEKDRDYRFQSARDIAFALSEHSSAVGISTKPARRRRFGAYAVIAGLLVAGTLVYILSRGRLSMAPASSSRPAAGSNKVPRIVVLPFENLGNPQDAYFAAGVTEEIMTRLASLQGLSVISRVTATGYDRKGKTVGQIGSDLGVDFILEGTIQWDKSVGANSRVRVTPELIQVSDDTHLWSEHIDRATGDIFAVQSEVAENVVKAMGVKVVPREKAALTTASTTDMEAYDLYLRGLEHRNQSKNDLETAVRLFQAAVDRDPRFPQALAQLVKNRLLLRWYLFDRDPKQVAKAQELVDRLASLGPDLGETHIARAYFAYYAKLDYLGALEEFDKARVLQPSSSEVLEGSGYVYRRQGRWAEAAERLKEWVAIDPRNPIALVQYANTGMVLGRYAEIDHFYDQYLSLNAWGGNTWGRKALLQLLWRGDVEKAEAILAQSDTVVGVTDDQFFRPYVAFEVALARGDYVGALRQLESGSYEDMGNQWWFYPVELLRGEAQSLAGQTELAARSFEAARQKLEELQAKYPDDFRYPSSLGIALAGLGRTDEALRATAHAAELMPGSKDAWKALWHRQNRALTETMLGRQDEAIGELDYLLAHTGEISTQVLRLDPRWAPLKSNPRFRTLLAKYDSRGGIGR